MDVGQQFMERWVIDERGAELLQEHRFEEYFQAFAVTVRIVRIDCAQTTGNALLQRELGARPARRRGSALPVRRCRAPARPDLLGDERGEGRDASYMGHSVRYR